MTSTGDDDGANSAPDRDGGIESARMHLESIRAGDDNGMSAARLCADRFSRGFERFWCACNRVPHPLVHEPAPQQTEMAGSVDDALPDDGKPVVVAASGW